MADLLKDRHVVLTGAGGGLGGAVLETLLAAGATCHVPTLGSGEVVANERVQVTSAVDLTNEDAVTAFYASCPPLWASIHLAGGFAAAPMEDTKLADLRKLVDLNLTTTFLCCREAVRKLRRSPGTAGRIVNVSARSALIPNGGTVAYNASKGAVTLLTQSLAEELKGTEILVNAVAPSIIDTPANRKAMPNADFARWPKPAELARTITWLASPDNRLTSGAVIPVYGSA
jgi:NAD(P)-dependent dehydrogenase (short-subunit alcohol dehydrogenase family)